MIISHAACPDGFAAAWVARHCLQAQGRTVDVHFAFHGTEPPWDKIRGRDVYILDFAYKLKDCKKIADEAKSIKIIDHHKTAEEDLKSLPYAIFDMTKSGAGLTWDYFNPNTPRPWLVDYVEDRDLWAWKLQDSKEVNAYISTLELDFDVWDKMANEAAWGTVVTAGRAVLAKVKNYVAETKKNALRIDLEGYNVPIVNACQVNISELVGELAAGEPFAMGWFQLSDGRFQYSLRSNGDFDVSVIARKYGGGGHAQSSGFQQNHPFHLDHHNDSVPWKIWLLIVVSLIGLWAVLNLIHSP